MASRRMSADLSLLFSQLLLLFSAALMVTALLACGTDSKKEENTAIPNISVQCQSGQVPLCSGTGLTIYIGLVESLNTNCTAFFIQYPSNALRIRQFTASSATSSSRFGVYLIGSFTQWFNANSTQITSLDKGTFKACAFVDANNNDRLDTLEPVGEADVEMGSGGLVLTNWAPANI